MPRCRDCPTQIAWYPTAATGRMMPINAKSDPAGNVIIEDGRAVVVGPDDPRREDHAVYMPHWARCPGAKHRRRAKAGARG